MNISCGKNRVFRYGACYLIGVTVLFALVFFEGFSPLFVLNELQTALTVYFTGLWIDFLEFPVQLIDNRILFEHGVNLRISHLCNGITPILLFVAAVIAYPTSLPSKIKWISGAYIGLSILNTLRIYFITVMVLDEPDCFEFYHDYVARYTMGALTLFLFYLFTMKAKVSV